MKIILIVGIENWTYFIYDPLNTLIFFLSF